MKRSSPLIYEKYDIITWWRGFHSDRHVFVISACVCVYLTDRQSDGPTTQTAGQKALTLATKLLHSSLEQLPRLVVVHLSTDHRALVVGVGGGGGSGRGQRFLAKKNSGPRNRSGFSTLPLRNWIVSNSTRKKWRGRRTAFRARSRRYPTARCNLTPPLKQKAWLDSFSRGLKDKCRKQETIISEATLHKGCIHRACKLSTTAGLSNFNKQL